MAVRSKKIDAKDVIARTRAARVEKRNITYRIDSDLLDRFHAALESEDLSGNQVVENMIQEFVESWEGNRRR